jgi:DNA gyrase subunit A
MERFSLTEVQANYILDTPLRRLTRFDRLELEREKQKLDEEIAALTAILESDELLRKTVSDELAEIVKQFGSPRRTVLLEAAGTATSAVPLEVADDPCRVLLSSTGLLARTMADGPPPGGDAADRDGGRAKHDVIVSTVRATARGEIGVVTNLGRLVRLTVLDLPTLPPTAAAPNLTGGAPLSEFVELGPDERVLCLATLEGGIALGTLQGVVKRVTPDYNGNRDSWDLIALREGDEVVGAVELATGEEDLVFITSDAQLLRFSANLVRPQGRQAGGMAGVKLADGATAISFTALDPARDAVVVTVAGSSGALPGTDTGSIKVTSYQLYPAKGRATGGVRCQRFLRGEDQLILGWAGPAPARAASRTGSPVELPALDPRRDGSGTPLPKPISAVG